MNIKEESAYQLDRRNRCNGFWIGMCYAIKDYIIGWCCLRFVLSDLNRLYLPVTNVTWLAGKVSFVVISSISLRSGFVTRFYFVYRTFSPCLYKLHQILSDTTFMVGWERFLWESLFLMFSRYSVYLYIIFFLLSLCRVSCKKMLLLPLTYSYLPKQELYLLRMITDYYRPQYND